MIFKTRWNLYFKRFIGLYRIVFDWKMARPPSMMLRMNTLNKTRLNNIKSNFVAQG